VIFINTRVTKEVHADRAEYNVDDETGKFYNVRAGAAPASTRARRSSPRTIRLYFQGEWAERLQERKHFAPRHGDQCKLPKSVVTLRGPTFDIIPDDAAIAHKRVFRLKGVPLFYTRTFTSPSKNCHARAAC